MLDLREVLDDFFEDLDLFLIGVRWMVGVLLLLKFLVLIIGEIDGLCEKDKRIRDSYKMVE